MLILMAIWYYYNEIPERERAPLDHSYGGSKAWHLLKFGSCENCTVEGNGGTHVRVGNNINR